MSASPCQVRGAPRALLALLTGSCSAAWALGPSDCLPRDADSTCASAVARSTTGAPPYDAKSLLYDGRLGGVPPTGYAFWGFDFESAARGVTSPSTNDMYFNRSSAVLTVTLSFDIPTTHTCGQGCMPGLKFIVGLGWDTVFPPLKVEGGLVTATLQVNPGQAYGWVVGLWQATNPRLTLSVPTGAAATLALVGQSADPAIAQEIPAVLGMCDCWDLTPRPCSAGSRFSNGLMGYWYQSTGYYVRAGSFNECPPNR